MRHLLMAQQQESFLPFSSRRSLSCCLSRVAKRSPPKPCGPLYSPSEPCGPFLHSEPRGPLFTSPKLPDPGPLPFPSEPPGTLLFYFRTAWCTIYFRAAWSTLSLLRSRVVYSTLWLPGLGFKSQCPSSFAAHFRLLLQSVTPASIPVFFQLYWAAIVSLGRCGPMAWSQSSPSSPTGPVTRGSCFPVPSWVEFAPIPLAQSMATAT